MDQAVFFSFGSNLITSIFLASPIDQKIDHLKLIKGDYTNIDFPVIFEQKSGHRLLDILDTGYVGLFLISHKLKILLEKNSLTGWKTFPIVLNDRNNNQIPGYHGFSVTGRCESTNFAKSKIVEKPLFPSGPIIKFYKGIFINRWDGADFFSPQKNYQTFVTKKTADLLKKNKTTNLRLENTTKYEIDVRYVKHL